MCLASVSTRVKNVIYNKNILTKYDFATALHVEFLYAYLNPVGMQVQDVSIFRVHSTSWSSM